MTILEIWAESKNFKYSTTTGAISVGGTHKSGGYMGQSRGYLEEASWMTPQLDRANYEGEAYRKFIEREAPEWVKKTILNDWVNFNTLVSRSQMSWMNQDDCLASIQSKEIGNRLLLLLR